MDRFQLPTYAEEFYMCDSCGEHKHYEEFSNTDSTNVCKECSGDDYDNDEPDNNMGRMEHDDCGDN